MEAAHGRLSQLESSDPSFPVHMSIMNMWLQEWDELFEDLLLTYEALALDMETRFLRLGIWV